MEQEALIGRKIAGKFAVEAFIGSGAMGAVYRARQIALDKVVALKLLHRELARDATFPARFMREAKAASRIDHPNSMRVVDFGEESDGTLYMAMEFLDGRDLFQVIQNEWPMPPPRIADLVMQTLAALAVAHDMGVVHRDLKPENIMVLTAIDDEGNTKDLVKVCDFGIAKIMDDRSESSPGHGENGQREQGKLTTHGLVVGTPEYMSPEQGRGEPLDARADLYSVGVILYQLLTGTVPFEANSALGVVLKHVTDIPLAPSQRVPTVEKKLEAICMKAMQKAREDRYQNAREMRADLRAFLEGGTPRLGVHQHVAPHSSVPPALQAGSGAGATVARTPLTTPHDLGVAATEVSIDSNAVRAASVRNYSRSGSRLTPLGTDIDNDLPAARGRWTGHLLAAVLLIGVAGVGVFLFRGTFTQSAAARDHVVAPQAEPSASASAAANAPGASASAWAVATDEPRSGASAEPAPSGHSAPPHAVHTSAATPSPESVVEQAPSAAPSASGSARAPAASASASASGSAPAGVAPAASASGGKGKGKRPRTSVDSPPSAPSSAPTWGVVPPTTPPIVSPSSESHDPPAPSPAPTE
ncbi:protein kinase [Pendulispora rubella]|uniref:Protein kinase n=1 Tax=Pendulispora rubella TaxID=2741070 RepID=A0ABZ2L078_9BACT